MQIKMRFYIGVCVILCVLANAPNGIGSGQREHEATSELQFCKFEKIISGGQQRRFSQYSVMWTEPDPELIADWLETIESATRLYPNYPGVGFFANMAFLDEKGKGVLVRLLSYNGVFVVYPVQMGDDGQLYKDITDLLLPEVYQSHQLALSVFDYLKDNHVGYYEDLIELMGFTGSEMRDLIANGQLPERFSNEGEKKKLDNLRD